MEGNFIDIASLNPNSRKVNAIVNVVEELERKEVKTRDGKEHRVAEFLVGDETGCIALSLWDDAIDKIEVGKNYIIENGYVSVYQNVMRLSPGLYGSMSPSEKEVKPNLENNVSQKS